MSRWHIVIEDDKGNIVGQFEVGSEKRRDQIHDGLPDDLAIHNERRTPDDANLGNSLQALSDNVVEWDERLIDL